MPNSRFPTVGYVVERFGPLGCVLAWLIAAYFLRRWLVTNINSGEISLSGLFSAVFGWAAIQTGFIFSVFGFVTTKTGGFIEKFRGTNVMAQFQLYTERAMYMGFVLTVYCIPLMVLKIDVSNNWVYWVVVAWFAAFIWAFTSFLRVALNFGRLAMIPDADYIPG
ncbi:hypothetical protein [Bradyrhizobium sp. DASA03120]|uniref:hypothetical protein n=1 Tax=Bradyrhizobium sp. SMVTL-02 TaxID=3395917 RepID=UPI003F72AE16